LVIKGLPEKHKLYELEENISHSNNNNNKVFIPKFWGHPHESLSELLPLLLVSIILKFPDDTYECAEFPGVIYGSLSFKPCRKLCECSI